MLGEGYDAHGKIWQIHFVSQFLLANHHTSLPCLLRYSLNFTLCMSYILSNLLGISYANKVSIFECVCVCVCGNIDVWN